MDVERVRQLFDPFEATCILVITCSRERPDRLLWSFEKHVIYTTKSGYMALMKSDRHGDEGLDGRWHWVLKMGVTPKVQFFTWRLLRGIIPKNLNLIFHFVNIEPVCVQCGDPVESTEHALRDCPGLVECWSSTHFSVDLHDQSVPFEVWVMHMVQQLTKENQELFVILLWAAWFAITEIVFRNVRIQDCCISKIAVTHLSNYKAIMARRPKVLSKVGLNRWCLPGTSAFYIEL